MPETAPAAATRYLWLKLLLVVALTVTMVILVMAHVQRVNGPWYWNWNWRRLTFWLYPAMLAAGLPFAAAQLFYHRGRTKLALLLLALAVLALELTALSLQPPTGLRRLPLIVQNVVNTSYFTDAVILYEQENISTWEWLYQYPDVVLLLHLHARYKPPGLMLFYLALISIFGKGALAATVGGSIIALVAALAPMTTYRMMKLFGQDETAAFCGASYLALCPSLLLFLPQFDQAYVTISAGLLILYGLTVMRAHLKFPLIFGTAMFVATFMSYIFLIYGLFFTVFWMVWVADRGTKSGGRAMARLIFAAFVCIGLYGLLWVFTGFDPITTFIVIEEAQTIALIPLMRPFPQHVLDDVLDFALGSGWISFLLVAFLFVRWGRGMFFGREPRHRFVQICILQILIVASAALLPGETARLWMLLLPMLMVPIGFELAEWPMRYRAIVYACLWLIMVVICQNMVFIYMGPALDGPRWAGH